MGLMITSLFFNVLVIKPRANNVMEQDEPFDLLGLKRTRASFDPSCPNGETIGSDEPSIFMQLWWNEMDMSAPKLRPVSTQVVLPGDIHLLRNEDTGIHVRVLAGEYAGCKNPMARTSHHPIMLLHVRVEAGAKGQLAAIPPSYNGFVWKVRGGPSRVCGTLFPDDPSTFLFLPPGGEIITLKGEGGDTELFIGLGEPHRAPCFKYVGYGGAFLHRSEEEVVNEMAKYESSPRDYGRDAIIAKDAAALAPASKLTSHLDLIPGFQSNGGPMEERPEGVIARFKYAESLSPEKKKARIA